MYSDTVKIKSRFLRSTRIDSTEDHNNISKGLVLHDTAEKLLIQLIEDAISGTQRAFTWTGPYGTGKSTLALYLAAILEKPASERKELYPTRGKGAFKRILKTLPADDEGWIVLPIVGTKDNVEEHIVAGLRRTFKEDLRFPEKASFADTLSCVLDHVKHTGKGFLLVVDELGRHLEHASEENGNLHCLQEIAELMLAANFPCAFLGILHQPFHEYAALTDRSKRQEWEKIQGRFKDIGFGISIEESVGLVASAIRTAAPPQEFEALCAKTCENLTGGRLSISQELKKSLSKCFPLHPLAVIILCLISRQKFGQNERSLFNFLASNEPGSFASYLKATAPSDTAFYTVDLLFDYLEANLSRSILSVDGLGRRWSEALECVVRAESMGETAASITKTVTLIDLFGRSVNLRPNREFIEIALPTVSRKKVDNALTSLEKNSIVIYRHHSKSYAVSEGSDLDLDVELEKVRVAIAGDSTALLAGIAKIRPVIAKKAFHETGTLRYFEVSLQLESVIRDVGIAPAKPEFDGVFILIFPDLGMKVDKIKNNKKQYSRLKITSADDKRPIVVGVLPNYKRLLELVSRFCAIDYLERNLVELQTDRVARRQLSARKHETHQLLINDLDLGFDAVLWEILGPGSDCLLELNQTMSQVASVVASHCYSFTPKIDNELINRRRPSAAAVKARRLLMKAMIENSDKHKLGIEKHPSELGLYFSILEKTGLHSEKNTGTGIFSFERPRGGKRESKNHNDFHRLWSVADGLLTQAHATGEPLAATEIMRAWMEPPYGLREGVIPILLLAYVLSSSEDLALYIDETFVTHLDDFFGERLTRSPKSVTLRKVKAKGVNVQVLSASAQFASEKIDVNRVDTALEVAKRLVQFALRLPKFSKMTKHRISKNTENIRSVLLRANDPHALLFDDLPKAAGFDCGLNSEGDIKNYISILQEMHNELHNAYPHLLDELGSYILVLFGEAKEDQGWRKIQERAGKIKGLGGDPSLNRMIDRLSGKDIYSNWVESVCSLSILKPVRDWDDDNQIVASKLKLKEFFAKINLVERYADKPEFREGAHVFELSRLLQGNESLILSGSFAVPSDGSCAYKLGTELKRLLVASDGSREDSIAALTILLEEVLEDKPSGSSEKIIDGEVDAGLPRLRPEVIN
jgi:hypothetical protein